MSNKYCPVRDGIICDSATCDWYLRCKVKDEPLWNIRPYAEDCAAQQAEKDMESDRIAAETVTTKNTPCPDCGGSHPEGECFYEDDFQPIETVTAEIATMPDAEFKANCEKLKKAFNGQPIFENLSERDNHYFLKGYAKGAAKMKAKILINVKKLLNPDYCTESVTAEDIFDAIENAEV